MGDACVTDARDKSGCHESISRCSETRSVSRTPLKIWGAVRPDTFGCSFGPSPTPGAEARLAQRRLHRL